MQKCQHIDCSDMGENRTLGVFRVERRFMISLRRGSECISYDFEGRKYKQDDGLHHPGSRRECCNYMSNDDFVNAGSKVDGEMIAKT